MDDGSVNQHVAPWEIKAIKALDVFDMVMLISEIHDYGWPMARKTLQAMLAAKHEDPVVVYGAHAGDVDEILRAGRGGVQ